MDDAKAEDFKKNSIFAKWDFHGGELVKTGHSIVRVSSSVALYMLDQADVRFAVWLV